MSGYYRSTGSGIGYPQWTRAVKILVIVCVVAFALQIFDGISGGRFTGSFGLTPVLVTQNFFLWQLVTYIFLHSTGQPFHLIFNMLGLWMFGSDLERLWGTRQFVKFFFICGIGAGILTVLLDPTSPVPMIGASGSVYGILLAFGMLFPNRIIYWIIFPIKAKWFVLILGGLAFFSSISATGSGVAHVAHVGGMLFGFLYMKGGGVFTGLRSKYDRWQRARLRRKFDVYYNDRQERGDSERWRRWK